MQHFLLTIAPFLLTMELFYLQLTIQLLYLQLELCTYTFLFLDLQLELLAQSGKVHLISALRDCKQRSLPASNIAPTESKKRFPLKGLDVSIELRIL